MELMSFIPEVLVIVIAACYVFGKYLKFSQLKDKYIPTVLLAFSVIFSVSITGLSAISILQGILCWGVSTGIYDIGNQLKK